MNLEHEEEFLEHFNRANVLVLGGAGFIGTALVRRLVSLEAVVTVVDNFHPECGGRRNNLFDLDKKVVVVEADLADGFDLELLENKEVVFNLAGKSAHEDSMTKPFEDLSANVTGPLTVLEGLRSASPNARVVFASTRQVYGKPGHLPVNETHSTRPVDVNGIHKLAGESYHSLFHSVYGMKTSCLRLTNTYGPRMRIKDSRQTFLGTWIRSAIEGSPLRIFGAGNQLRDFNFVDDVVDAFLLSAMRTVAVGKTYNLGSHDVVSLLRLAEMVREIVPSASWELVEFPPDRKRIDIGDYYSNFDLIRQELGWAPRTTLKQGLNETINFFRNHFQEFV